MAEQAAYWDEIFQHAYAAYFAGFALGCLLLLAGVIWRRKRLSVCGAIVLLLLLAISQQTAIDMQRGFIADQERRYEAEIKKLSETKEKEEVLRAQYLYMPEGESLAYLSLGNTSLAADYVWLTSLQYVSNAFRRGQKFEMLSRFYSTISELNPHWIDAQVNGGKVLSALNPDRLAVEKHYIQSIFKNPDDWQLPYETGRLFVVPPVDLRQQADYSRRAVEWFKEARAKPSLPRERRSELDDLIGRLSLESGPAFYEEAEKLLKQNASDSNAPEGMRDAARRSWLRAHSLVIVTRLQQEVDRYKQRTGRCPASLEEIYQALPGQGANYRFDAFDFPIDYLPESCTVRSHGVSALRAIQSAHVISELVNLFASENAGQGPKDLAELRDFLRKYYTPPHERPSAVVTDAIGLDLDPTNGPLGKWDYDAKTGTVRLPKEANARELYHNAYNNKFGLQPK